MKQALEKYTNTSLVLRIVIGLLVGIGLAMMSNAMNTEFVFISILGNLFVKALKSVAPILVFFLVMSSLSAAKAGVKTNMGSVLSLYLIGTLLSAFVGVAASFLFPITNLNLNIASIGEISPPSGVGEVLSNLLMNVVDNPINAIATANYIGVLSWAIIFGIALKAAASDATKQMISDTAEALSTAIKWIINLAPFGIMGLVYIAIAEAGISAMVSYGQLLLVLVGSMLVVALVLNPLIVFVNIKQNPYPLVFKCLRESAVTAFFTRSSAANIPVNMRLCESLDLNKDTYSVAIPLGATINMAGAAITISVLTLAAVNTLGIHVNFFSALLLSVVAAVSAAGTSGVAGGSLLLIPLACSLFNIDAATAAQVVGIGFVIGVVQDSCETAINSSTDVLFAATAEFKEWRKEGRAIKI